MKEVTAPPLPFPRRQPPPPPFFAPQGGCQCSPASVAPVHVLNLKAVKPVSQHLGVTVVRQQALR
jgi:hypothetical protein